MKLKWLGKSLKRIRSYHKISLIIAWIDKIFALIWRFVVSKKKKKGFWGVLEPFSIIKKVLKFVLIGIAVKMGV
ncbi:hypothetical protein [Helicobacter pylori]|uniref:hypothetical protein n=1 Tax=Helicobacter pylori TaxID=210 RepID=UPI000BEBE8DD|nr:hypothetical protein [Helicobacter pylori]PDX20600.1 hypothetical protein BB417_08035 [Helicobacter pylori]